MPFVNTSYDPDRVRRDFERIAGLLADRATHVDAIDLAPAMIAAARRRLGGLADIHFEVADLMERPLGEGVYDVIAIWRKALTPPASRASSSTCAAADARPGARR